MNEDKIAAIQTARTIIGMNPAFLDTETTGLDDKAQVVDVALIDSDGAELINSLIRPTAPIPKKATSIHGITNDDVSNAPTFSDIMPNLEAYQERLIVIYNRDYDLRVLAQSARANKVDTWGPAEPICAMQLYAEFHGDWNRYHHSYRWQKQSEAAQQLGIEIPEDLHRAAADANLCRLIVEAMAATPLPGEATQSSQLFIECFNSLAEDAHRTATQKGFWEDGQDRNDGEIFALFHREISEGFEALRAGNPPDDRLPEFASCTVELADTIIRIMDYAAAKGWPLAEAIVAKMKFNEGRPYKHGKEF